MAANLKLMQLRSRAPKINIEPIYQNPKLGCSMTVFQVNGVHYTSKRSDIEIMDRLNVPTKMDQNYGRSFLQLPFHWPHGIGSKQK